MQRATYFRVNAGEVKPDPLFATNTGWIGMNNLDFGGITIFNLDFQTVGGASGAVFLLNDCINVGNFSMEGRAGGPGDSLELTSGLSSGTFTLDATTYHIQNWYFKSTMTFTNTLALVGLSGTILDIGVDGNISLTDQTAYWNNVIYGNSGNTLTTVGTVILQAGGNALPPVPRQSLSVGTTVNYNYNNSTIPYAAAVPLDWAIVPTMTDTAIDYLAANKIWKPTATANQILEFDGTDWIAVDNTASVGQGVSFFLDDTNIIPTGVNNANPVNTLSKFPISTAEVADPYSVTNSTVLMEAYLYNTALGGTSIEAGAWNFDTWAGVNSATGVSQILTNIHKVSTPTGTITVTGAGASRTVDASAGTPFAVTNITASAVIDVASYLQTPTGLFQITARASDTQITIAVPVTYTNETTVAYSTWQRLFQVTTGEINNISPNYVLYNIVSVQPSFTSDPTDKLAAIYFARTDSLVAKTLTFTHNGTNRYSHFETPIIIRHNDLSGLQGGNATERYHLTAAEYAAISAGIGITEASSLALAAGGTITPSAASFQQWLVASSGGAVTLNAAPFTLVDPLNAVEITLIGNSSTDTITIVENDAVSGTLMNGNWTSSRGKIITFRFSTTLGRWVELSRSN